MVHRIAVIGTGFTRTGGKTPPPQIVAAAAAGFVPELAETRYGAFPGTPYDRGLNAVGYLDAGVAASRDGAAAVFINTFGDYGITELKSALSIPVVGAGEASMAVAATLGRRFAIVTIWPRTLRFIFDERIASCGMKDRCVDVISVLDPEEMAARGSAVDPVKGMRAGQAAILDRIVAGAEEALRRGADTIVLGCTCMAPIAAQIAARLPMPVVDPMTTGYKFTETLVSLRLTQSAAAHPRPSAERLADVGNLVAGVARVQPTEECEACVIAAE